MRLCLGLGLLSIPVLATALWASRPAADFAAATPQRGMTLLTWDHAGYDGPDVGPALRRMAGVGARWVQIVPTWYQDTKTANVFQPTANTVTDDGIRRAVGLAHAYGLKVFLKPHVDLLGEVSRTSIRPSDLDAWFASYVAYITHYAELAAGVGVEQFAVGTELAGVSGERDRWLAVVAEVRERYRGSLVYAATHDEYTRVGFWHALDLIGIDAYWPLVGHTTTDVAQLRRAWQPLQEELAAFAVQAGRPILFTEAGYTSQRGTTTEPASWRISRERDEAEQAAAYESLLATFSNQRWWAGVFWWVPAESPEYRDLGFTVDGKAAESVLRRWWRDPPPVTSDGAGW